MTENRRPTPSYSPVAGGHATLVERSPHVDALARLGDLRGLLRSWSEVRFLDLSRDEARRRLRSLPRTADIDAAIDAVDRARLGDRASPVTVELLLSAFLEVVPTPRTVRKVQLIAAAKAHLATTGPVLASVLRSMVPHRREAPTVAELREGIAAEVDRLETVSDQLVRLDGLRSAAVIALDWRDPAEAAFLAEVGDPVPPGWPGIGPDAIDW